MAVRFDMPTRVLLEADCVKKNAAQLAALGKKALIVTGAHSARACGALQDMTEALSAQGCGFAVFGRVEANPSIATVRAGAAAAREAGADFVVGIGGGSPMDAAKAVALLARQEIADGALFSGRYAPDILPLALVPTTAGTGSEVTQYSVLTNDEAQTKTSIASPLLFPKLALVDPRYTAGLPLRTTVNTAIDALSHCVEGMLSARANPLADLLAGEGIRKISGRFGELLSGKIGPEARADLIYASTLGGMVIAHTGTTAVHSMGYSLTYFHHIDHGRANGLLLASFLAFVEKKDPETVRRIAGLMGLGGTGGIRDALGRLLGEKETLTAEELERFADLSIKARNIANCAVVPNREDLRRMYAESFGFPQ